MRVLSLRWLPERILREASWKHHSNPLTEGPTGSMAFAFDNIQISDEMCLGEKHRCAEIPVVSAFWVLKANAVYCNFSAFQMLSCIFPKQVNEKLAQIPQFFFHIYPAHNGLRMINPNGFTHCITLRKYVQEWVSTKWCLSSHSRPGLGTGVSWWKTGWQHSLSLADP